MKDPNMTTQTLLIAVILVAAGVCAYIYMRQPAPIGERFDSAVSHMNQGEPGKAADALAPQTRGEKLENEVKDAISPTVK